MQSGPRLYNKPTAIVCHVSYEQTSINFFDQSVCVFFFCSFLQDLSLLMNGKEIFMPNKENKQHHHCAVDCIAFILPHPTHAGTLI